VRTLEPAVRQEHSLHPAVRQAGAFEPTAQQARALGLPDEGPWPADTLLVRAKAGQFNAVLTTHHDLGQTPLKLLGSEWGVTPIDCFPFPI
jgi:4-hydroxythreonine-4-phosphate dehydrogenase